jgi:cytochrome oxidase Cu insertion factor (SCO1/SenC/PrrC family)
MTASRAQLIGLVLLFSLPVVLAWVFYSRDWRPTDTKNNGNLVIPVRPLDARVLKDLEGTPLGERYLTGRWTLVYVGDGSCELHCRQALHGMRQVRLALDKDMQRVQRLYVATAALSPSARAALVKEQPGLQLATAPPPWVGAFALDERPAHSSGRIYLVDPQSFLMMYYESGSEPKGMLRDLERLLKVSQLG